MSFERNTREELKADLHFPPFTQTPLAISSPCTPSPTCYCCPYSTFWLLPNPLMFFTHYPAALPSFQQLPIKAKLLPTLQFLLGTEILLQQITEALPVLCSLEGIKLCHHSSKLIVLSVTVKKAFTLPDGEN